MLDTTAYLMTATHPRMVKHINQSLGHEPSHILSLHDYQDIQAGLLRPMFGELCKVAVNELQFQHKMQMISEEQIALSEKLQTIDVENLTDHEMNNPDGYASIESKSSTICKMLKSDLANELDEIKQRCDNSAEQIFQKYTQLRNETLEELEQIITAYFQKNHPSYKLNEAHFAPLRFVCISQVKEHIEILHLKPEDLPVSLEKAIQKSDEFIKLQIFLTICTALNHIDVS